MIIALNKTRTDDTEAAIGTAMFFFFLHVSEPQIFWSSTLKNGVFVSFTKNKIKK